MSEIKEFKRDYPLRILKIYKKYGDFSEFSFSFALMTFQSVMAVLGDTQGKNLAKEIQQNDFKKDLAKYSFFYSPNDNQNDYWNCFNNLRNASSHILENYTPKNNEHKFVKISYTTNKMGRKEYKEITSKDLKNFLLTLLSLLNKEDSSLKWFNKYFYLSLFKKFFTNIILLFKTQVFRGNIKDGLQIDGLGSIEKFVNYFGREINKVEVFINCTLGHFLLFHNVFHSDAIFVKLLLAADAVRAKTVPFGCSVF